MSGRFNGIGGFPRGDKGRIETSLVPPWKSNREEIITLNKLSNTNAINKMVCIALSKRQIPIYKSFIDMQTTVCSIFLLRKIDIFELTLKFDSHYLQKQNVGATLCGRPFYAVRRGRRTLQHEIYKHPDKSNLNFEP